MFIHQVYYGQLQVKGEEGLMTTSLFRFGLSTITSLSFLYRHTLIIEKLELSLKARVVERKGPKFNRKRSSVASVRRHFQATCQLACLGLGCPDALLQVEFTKIDPQLRSELSICWLNNP